MLFCCHGRHFVVKTKKRSCYVGSRDHLTTRNIETFGIWLESYTTMGVLSTVSLAILHPLEFRILLQYWLYHEPRRDIAAQKEHADSGWDRKSMRRCWEFLDVTSRSFSAVIKEIDGDLARTVSSSPLSPQPQHTANFS